MASQTKSVVVHAPVERVFTYLDDPMHLPEIWPSLMEITDVHSLANGGHTNRWTYKMAGMRLKGTSEDVEHIANERIVSKSKGGIDSTQTWMVQPEGDDTKVTFKVDYTIPVPVLGKLAEAAIIKLNDHEGDVIVANLRTILEEA
ncbi:MAG: SRPBCC family protein [Actinomycetota bacterium]|nr:SRPBCC family protein [Actinomycetota bacterium]